MKHIKIAHLEIAMAVVAIAVGSIHAHVALPALGVLILAAVVSAVIGMVEERKGRRREWCGLAVMISLVFGRQYVWPGQSDIWSALLYCGIFLLIFAVVSLLFGKGRGANKTPHPTTL